jgi:hypothetical protein
MTVRLYSSTDASAPTLQGVVGGASFPFADGSLANLLDKILVAGYGSTTAAGWTRSFTATSHATWRQGAGSQLYLDCLDDGSLTAGAREAEMFGIESATAVGAGTNFFPTTAQQSTGIKVRKSNTADTTQRTWFALADNKTFTLFTNFSYGAGSTEYYSVFHFGDFYSFKSSDAYNCIIIGRITSATADAQGNETFGAESGSAVGTQIGHYVARGYNQAAGSVQVGKSGEAFSTNTAALQQMGNANHVLNVPNPEDSGLYLMRSFIIDPTTTPTTNLRGFLRGIWAPQHNGALIPLEYTWQGQGGLSGRTFKLPGLKVANAAYVAVETSSTWD